MLTATKFRLRNVLQRDLYKLVAPLLKRDGGATSAMLVYEFMLELERCSVSIPEFQNPNVSNVELIERLDQFQLSSQPSTKSRIENIQVGARKHFDGLCLDCINDTERVAGKHIPKNCPLQRVYGSCHCEVDWDEGCRIKHGQPTWYYSTMATEFKYERLFQ